MLPRVSRLRQALARPRAAFAAVFANPNLRRLQLAGALSVIGSWSYSTALAVYAYQAGGATAVGVLGVVRMLPAALGAPFTAGLGDRFRRERVMVGADVVNALLMAAITAAIVADAGEAVVFALAGCASLTGTAFRPAQAALLPSLARTPDELTASNVAASTIVSLGGFLGPAVAGAMLIVTDVEWVVALNGATFLWSAALVLGVRAPAAEPSPMTRKAAHTGAFAGFGTITEERRIRHLVTLFSAQTLVDGMRPVLVVTAAFTILELDQSGVGFLNSALGVGGLAGAAVALALAGGRRLGTSFAIGLALWGGGLALIAAWPVVGFALLCIGIIGIGNTVVDVSGYTLLQRAAPDEVLSRVFGALESLMLGTTMLGALLAPLLIEWLGIRAALVAAGGLLPVLAVLSIRQLRVFDEVGAPPATELLRSVPILTPLPEPALERLATGVVPAFASDGDEIMRRGDPGDRFYVIVSGEVAVELEGSETVLGPGDYFGEIALLRDVPRTASVRARGEVEMLALEREDFLAAVTSSAASAEAADAVVSARLGALLRPGSP